MYGLIYLVTNTINGKQYVGQTKRLLFKRWDRHLKSALRYFSDGALHRAIRKYGAGAFKVEQIALAESQKELNEKEARYVAQFGTLSPGGYNLTTAGDGYEVSEEARRKNSLSKLGHRVSEETRRKLSESNTGQKRSEEARQRMSKAAIGRTVSEDTCQRISRGLIGRTPSVETRQRISLAKKKVSCKYNHPLSGVNLHVDPRTNRRVCLTCWYLRHNVKLPERFKQYAYPTTP